MDGNGVIVRRVIPSDNSCLFNAVGYVMEHDKTKAADLRKVIVATVTSDPEKYSEAFLGKPNEKYCFWILDPEKWGGAIELSILVNFYGREIAAYDTQTTRCDYYGQEMNYTERVMLIYDGLHFDALVMCPAEGAPESSTRQYLRCGGMEPSGHSRNSRLTSSRTSIGKGSLLTPPISPYAAGCARLLWLARRKQWNMHKP